MGVRITKLVPEHQVDRDGKGFHVEIKGQESFVVAKNTSWNYFRVFRIFFFEKYLIFEYFLAEYSNNTVLLKV
jgi:hypothetical protein